MWLDTQDAGIENRPTLRSTVIQTTRPPSGPRWLREFKVFFLFLETAAATFVYIFYTLSATGVLNSFEDLRITLAAAGNSFARELNPHGGAYIYIYIYIRGSLNKFPAFFRMGTFNDSTHMKL